MERVRKINKCLRKFSDEVVGKHMIYSLDQKSNSNHHSGKTTLNSGQLQDLIYLPGPLTEDAVLKCLQARFTTKQYYVSLTNNYRQSADAASYRLNMLLKKNKREPYCIKHTIINQHYVQAKSLANILATIIYDLKIRTYIKVRTGRNFRKLRGTYCVLIFTICTSRRLKTRIPALFKRAAIKK